MLAPAKEVTRRAHWNWRSGLSRLLWLLVRQKGSALAGLLPRPIPVAAPISVPRIVARRGTRGRGLCLCR